MRLGTWFATGLVLAATAAGSPACADDKAQRIVSLNLCTDQIVLGLVPRARIAALSHLAADATVSAAAEAARGIPATRGEAESVLGFDPDLVLAGTFTTPATLDLLARIGRRVVKVPLASDVAGIRAAIRAVAQAVGESARGEAMIRHFDDGLGRIAGADDAGTRPTALVYQVNGLSSGPGSLADHLLGLAGFSNQAAALGLGAGGALPLETLAEAPPDLIVLSGPADEYRTVVADNLRHPAFRAVVASHAAVTVPWRFWLCGTQHTLAALEALVAARRGLAAGTQRQ